LQKETASKRSAIINPNKSTKSSNVERFRSEKQQKGSRKEDQIKKLLLLLLLLPHMNKHIHKRVGLRGGDGVRQKMRRRNAAKSEQHSGV
jgi:hypothetical protein